MEILIVRLRFILCYGKDVDLLGLPNGIDHNAIDKSKNYKDEIRNTVVKNESKTPMSKVTLPIGFSCAVETMIVKSRLYSFTYYYQDAVIENYKLTNEVIV